MSEEMILSGAFFDNSMPKWATEETMKRIGNDLKKDNTQTRKQHDKMILLLGKIVQNSTKEEKNQKETLKEIKSIAKEIKDSNKTNKELVKEVKKSNKLADEANKQAKKTFNTTNQKGESIDTSEMEGYLLDANKTLEKIFTVMKQSSVDMARTMEERNKMMGRSALRTPKPSNDNVVRDRTNALDDIIRSSMEDVAETNNRRGRRGSRITNEITSSKNPVKRFNGRIMSMMAAIGSFVKRIKQLGGMLFDLIKKIPLIGAKVAAVATAMGAALDFANIINEHYTEYKDAIDAGLYLARQNVENTRMDGIMVRKMIGEVGLTVLAGIESMHENISAVNELGLEQYFSTIGEVMGDAQNKEAFINRVMMNQGEIAKFTGRFLKMLKSTSDFERLNSLERSKSVQTFIRSTRMFSQLTGKSMEHLTKLMEQAQADPRVTTRLAGIQDEDQRDNARLIVSNVAQAIGDTNNPLYQAFATSFTDVTGAGVRANTELADKLTRISAALYGDDRMISKMDEIAELARQGDVDSANKLLREYINQNQAAYDNLTEAQSVSLNVFDDLSNVLAGVLESNANMIKDKETGDKIVESGGNISEQSTELAKEAQRVKATQQQAEAAIEYAMANAAGSEMSRDAMLMGYDIMIKTNDLTEKGARAAVTTAHAIMDNLPSIGRDVYDILSILDDDRESRKEKAENALGTFDMGAQARMQRESLVKALKESGFSTTDGKEGGTRGEMAARYRASKRNIENFENLGMSVEDLVKQSESSQRQTASVARDMLMYMGSEQMRGVLSKRDRENYREALNQVLEKMPEDQREAYYSQMEQKLRTGATALMFESVVDQRSTQRTGGNIQNQINTNDDEKTKSEAGQAVNDAARQAEEAENQRQAQRTQTPTRNESGQDVTFNENGIPNTIARQDANVDNQQNGVNVMSILNDNLNLMNSKLDDLIGITKITSEESQNIFRDIKINTGRNGGSVGS